MKVELFLVLLGLLICTAFARRGSITNDLFDNDVDDEPHADDDTDDNEPRDVVQERRRNPCFRKKCYRGETCVLDEQLKAKCVCQNDCSFYQTGDRYKVCSNKNVTYATECDLDSEHCRCKRKEEGCNHPNARKIQLEYYGACQDLPDCPEGQALQFPSRMRNWLFIVIEEMARRAEIGEYEELARKAAEDEHHAYAVIWKFCDLDTDPQDRHVSKRELQYTVRTLRALEGCIMPFLDDCDTDDNRQITLNEWGKCLELADDEIKDKCHSINKHKPERK